MRSMRFARPLAMLFAAAVLLCAAAWSASWNQRTVVRFDQPVQIPGTVLQPGTYVFKVVNSDKASGHDTVQVFNADETQQIATVLANDASRDSAHVKPVDASTAASAASGENSGNNAAPASGAVFVFNQSGQAAQPSSGTGSAQAGSAPLVLRFWFPAGMDPGLDFIYPDPSILQGSRRVMQVGSDYSLSEGGDNSSSMMAQTGGSSSTSSGTGSTQTGSSTYQDNAGTSQTAQSGSTATSATTGQDVTATSPATGSTSGQDQSQAGQAGTTTSSSGTGSSAYGTSDDRAGRADNSQVPPDMPKEITANVSASQSAGTTNTASNATSATGTPSSTTTPSYGATSGTGAGTGAAGEGNENAAAEQPTGGNETGTATGAGAGEGNASRMHRTGRHLPRTGSDLPLALLVGFASVAGGLVLRRFARIA